MGRGRRRLRLLPAQVKASADLLKDQVQHYIFVSSISAYADLTPPGIDEDYKLAQLDDPDAKEITEKNYGGLKAACEQIVEQTFGARQAVIRPTYIVGPGDHTDRFTYWPVRFARGGEMLAPGTPADPIQFIDVRDLAEFMRVCVEQRIAGRYNACNPPGAVTMGELLDTSKRLTREPKPAGRRCNSSNRRSCWKAARSRSGRLRAANTPARRSSARHAPSPKACGSAIWKRPCATRWRGTSSARQNRSRSCARA